MTTFKHVLKLTGGRLLNTWDEEMVLGIDRCDICKERFVDAVHNNPGEAPDEMAICICEPCNQNH